MNEHHFLLLPGTWEGRGHITFNMSAERLDFSTLWTIEHKEDSSIHCVQKIDIDDVEDPMINYFELQYPQNQKFDISLSNEILGQIKGSGLLDDKIMAWEFRGSELEFEGFELFERQEDGSYKTRAEFSSKDQMRTLIEGSITKKA